jgi:membrane-associated phospholipid phosphatase
MKTVIKILIILLLGFQAAATAQNPDIDLLRKINSPVRLKSDGFFRIVSYSDPYLIAVIPAGMTAAGYFKCNSGLMKNGITGLAALAVTGGLTTILKYSVNRPRPFVTYHDIEKKAKAGTPSFPSGHTSGAFATATYLSIEYPKWYVILPAYTWAATAGYSRMHLGVHYPSDVLAGAIIGSGCAWLTHKISTKLLTGEKMHRGLRPPAP